MQRFVSVLVVKTRVIFEEHDKNYFMRRVRKVKQIHGFQRLDKTIAHKREGRPLGRPSIFETEEEKLFLLFCCFLFGSFFSFFLSSHCFDSLFQRLTQLEEQ